MGRPSPGMAANTAPPSCWPGNHVDGEKRWSVCRSAMMSGRREDIAACSGCGHRGDQRLAEQRFRHTDTRSQTERAISRQRLPHRRDRHRQFARHERRGLVQQRAQRHIGQGSSRQGGNGERAGEYFRAVCSFYSFYVEGKAQIVQRRSLSPLIRRSVAALRANVSQILSMIIPPRPITDKCSVALAMGARHHTYDPPEVPTSAGFTGLKSRRNGLAVSAKTPGMQHARVPRWVLVGARAPMQPRQNPTALDHPGTAFCVVGARSPGNGIRPHRCWWWPWRCDPGTLDGG